MSAQKVRFEQIKAGFQKIYVNPSVPNPFVCSSRSWYLMIEENPPRRITGTGGLDLEIRPGRAGLAVQPGPAANGGHVCGRLLAW